MDKTLDLSGDHKFLSHPTLSPDFPSELVSLVSPVFPVTRDPPPPDCPLELGAPASAVFPAPVARDPPPPDCPSEMGPPTSPVFPVTRDPPPPDWPSEPGSPTSAVFPAAVARDPPPPDCPSETGSPTSLDVTASETSSIVSAGFILISVLYSLKLICGCGC
ncbi:hypothetical protein B0H11DRAFT_1962498 [Mycena galericulata]|nr:hypothetical protein B0H11DRAFT_1962498 [Mycena galericulata]